MKLALPLSILAGLVSMTQARLNMATTVQQQEAEMVTELGRKKKKSQATGWHNLIHVTFKMDHFKSFDEPGEFNKKVAVGAFNRAFEQAFEGIAMDWDFIDSLIQIPEPEYLSSGDLSYPRPRPGRQVPKPKKDPRHTNTWTIYYGSIHGDATCRLCPNDFLGSGASGESFSNFLKDQAKWDDVGKLFCAELKGTGIDNFEDVKNCAFTVGYVGENEIELMESATTAALASDVLTEVSGHTNAIVTTYSIQPSAVLDMEALEKAFTVAYNNVFEDTDFVVEGVQLLRQVVADEMAVGQSSVRAHGNEIAVFNEADEAGDDGDADTEDADEDVDFLTTMYWLQVNWTCKGSTCSADDMLPGAFLQNTPGISRHTILESYFCHNLREFGDASLTDVDGCDIMFLAGM
ncbi:hypothetical protein FisN_22Hu159 [Fistulifera solaris]|jgi:hypothetical protein|uniref:Uncharacterized protein n=1 Tax=Fistulifera solaris TaxID=1519565 RepID=A0A1Z5JPM5_FISSO|nr:hypothetical protein FisN_22Hu159 [Fistulifera solaris]|eukprot:GAX15985.1 hypothetical protein FisN_22Hu159 [Fistulifera solaris]